MKRNGNSPPSSAATVQQTSPGPQDRADAVEKPACLRGLNLAYDIARYQRFVPEQGAAVRATAGAPRFPLA